MELTRTDLFFWLREYFKENEAVYPECRNLRGKKLRSEQITELIRRTGFQDSCDKSLAHYCLYQSDPEYQALEDRLMEIEEAGDIYGKSDEWKKVDHLLDEMVASHAPMIAKLKPVNIIRTILGLKGQLELF